MKPKLLSIIVAVYNVDKYLRECVESLLNQTYPCIEIILVDDGSSDNSGQICDEYMARDKRVKVFHQPNSGVSRARNVGLDMAEGDYVTIIDSDDYVLPETFASVIEVLEQHDLDAVGFSSFRSGKGGGGSGKVSLSLEAEHDKRLQDCLSHEGAVAWGSVFKKAIWEGIRYPEGRFFEDSVVAPFIVDRLQRTGYIDKQFYYYRVNNSGTCQTSAFKPHRRYDFILAGIDRLNFATKKNMCVLQARTALLKAIMSYFTAFYGMNMPRTDEQYLTAAALLRKERNLPYDASLLNGKYKIYLWCFDRLDFIHRWGAKISLWSKQFKR